MHTRLIDTFDDFRQLGPQWDELLERSGLASPFLTHEWLEAWWREYTGDHDVLRVVCCLDEATGSLVGVLPTYVRHGSGPFAGRRLRFLGDGLGATLLDCIVDPQFQQPALTTIVEELAAERSGWDVLELHRLGEASPFRLALVERFSETGGRQVLDVGGSCPVIALPEDWDQYLGTLSRRERSRLRRLRRDLESVGSVGIERIEEQDALPRALDDALRMFEQGMSRRHDRTFSVPDRYRRFLKSVSESFLAQGRLRLMFLTVDGERIAFVYQMRHGDTMFAYQTAFDEAWAPQHVGFAVFGYAIEGAIDEGCSHYGFGVGDTEYKFRFGVTDVRELHGVRVYRDSLAGRLAGTRDSTARWGREFVKRYSPPPLSQRLSRVASWRTLERL